MQTFLDIIDVVFRDTPGRHPSEISHKIGSGIYVLFDSEGEVMSNGTQLRQGHREARTTGRLELRLMKKGENFSLIFSPTTEKQEEGERDNQTTLKERVERHLEMLRERAKAGDHSAINMLRDRLHWEEPLSKKNKEKAKQAFVESDSENSDHDVPGPSAARKEVEKKRAVHVKNRETGPCFEFFTSDDPNTPPKVIREVTDITKDEVDVQPALLWRGPASLATSSRAKAAAKAKNWDQHVVILPQKPNELDMKLDASFVQSLDKSFVLGMPEYQSTAPCSVDTFLKVFDTWDTRLREARNHDAQESPGLLRLTITMNVYMLFVYFVPKQDDSPLVQKFCSALIQFEKVRIQRLTSIYLLLTMIRTDYNRQRASFKNYQQPSEKQSQT